MPDGAARILCLPPYAATGVRTQVSSLELHHDPGPLEGGYSSEAALEHDKMLLIGSVS